MAGARISREKRLVTVFVLSRIIAFWRSAGFETLQISRKILVDCVFPDEFRKYMPFFRKTLQNTKKKRQKMQRFFVGKNSGLAYGGPKKT